MKLYERINEGKIQKLRGNAKKVYEESMSTHLQEDGRYFCFHPKDLEQMHGNAIKITMQLFDTKINNKSSKDDEQRLCLLDVRILKLRMGGYFMLFITTFFRIIYYLTYCTE